MRHLRTTPIVSAVLFLWACGIANGGIVLAPGFDYRVIATGTQPTGKEYNPVTDTWLAIDTAGFDYITEATRSGVIRTIASTFGGGGLTYDMLSVTRTTNVAWITEPHGRYVYTLTPATLGCTKRLVGSAPGYPGSPERCVAEALPDGSLLAGFGPVMIGTPEEARTSWYYVTPDGQFLNTLAMQTTRHILAYLRRDHDTGAYYGMDYYDETNSGDEPYFNPMRGRLVTLSTNPWQVNPIRQYLGFSLHCIEPDHSHAVVPTDCLWAIRADGTTTDIVELDPLTGEIGMTLLSVDGGWSVSGLTLAPATEDPSRVRLYTGLWDGQVYRLIEITPEPASTGMLLGLLAMLLGRRASR